jgi:hypothetical protein
MVFHEVRWMCLLAGLAVAACGGGGGSGDDAPDGGDDAPDGGGGGLAEVVSVQPDILALALALAPDGSPRVAFRAEEVDDGPEQMFYAEPDGGGGWTVERLADPPISSPLMPALAVDGAGTPHLMYAVSGGPRYVRRDGGSWTGVMLAEPGTYALAIGPGDSVHVAVANGARYGGWNGSGFDLEDLPGDPGFVDLAVAADGTVHVVTDGGSSRSSYTVGTSGAFTATDIVTPLTSATRPAIALESGGQVNVAVSAAVTLSSAKGLYRLRLDGGTWTETELVSTAQEGLAFATMAVVDGDDGVHLGVAHPLLLYFRPDGAGGHTLVPVNTESFRNLADLAVEPDGTTHAIFAQLGDGGVELHHVLP